MKKLSSLCRFCNHKADYILILHWNHKEEIMGKMNYIRQWGGKFITAIPKVIIY